MFTDLKNNLFKYIFFLVLIFYAIFYGPYGIEEGDMGSIFGISWSIYNGYFPHRDFVYIKPAFSPFFHSLPLYISEDYAYLINRYFYFIQVFTYSYLATVIGFNYLKLSKKHLFFIATIGAIISVHNYAPMPWNTVDGIFFSVIGLYFIIKNKEKWWSISVGALFLFLGALCKQSFYFFPIIIAFFLIYHKQIRAFLILAISGMLLTMLYLLFFWWQGALEPFINQMFSFTTGSSLIDTGIKSYYLAVKFNLIAVIIAALVVWFSKKHLKGHTAYFLTNVIIDIVFLWLYYKNQSLYASAKYGIIHLLWLFGSLYVLVMSLKNSKYTIMVVLFSLAWCASISNGYNTPIDFSTPIVITLALFFLGELHSIKQWSALIITTLYIGTFFYGYQYPYRERHRSELNYNLGEIFPRLKGIHTNKDRYDKFNELKELSSRYNNFTILPSMTLGHYITDTPNPIGVDWVFNHHLADQLENYKQMLNEKDLTIFVENFENHIDNYEESSLLTMYVAKNWKLIENKNHFRVYKKP